MPLLGVAIVWVVDLIRRVGVHACVCAAQVTVPLWRALTAQTRQNYFLFAPVVLERTSKSMQGDELVAWLLLSSVVKINLRIHLHPRVSLVALRIFWDRVHLSFWSMFLNRYLLLGNKMAELVWIAHQTRRTIAASLVNGTASGAPPTSTGMVLP